MKNYKLIDFKIDFDFNDLTHRGAYLDDELLIFTKFSRYVGPITLQYLENGGIQSLYNYHLIIKDNNGFLCVDELIVNGNTVSSKEFIESNKDFLINKVLF